LRGAKGERSLRSQEKKGQGGIKIKKAQIEIQAVTKIQYPIKAFVYPANIDPAFPAFILVE